MGQAMAESICAFGHCQDYGTDIAQLHLAGPKTTPNVSWAKHVLKSFRLQFFQLPCAVCFHGLDATREDVSSKHR